MRGFFFEMHGNKKYTFFLSINHVLSLDLLLNRLDALLLTVLVVDMLSSLLPLSVDDEEFVLDKDLLFTESTSGESLDSMAATVSSTNLEY